MSIFSEKDMQEVQNIISKETGQPNPLPKREPVKDEIEELNKQSERIQQLIAEIDNLPDPHSRMLMQECIQQMLTFYGEGLKRIMNIISKETEIITEHLIEDSFINGLLLIHDLHPLSLETRLENALKKVKPYMDSHGGSVEVVSLENGIAKLKLSGSCNGCPSSSVTLELGIKEAIEEHCPDLAGLEVEGITTPKRGINGVSTGEKGWKILNDLNDLPNGTMKPILDGSGKLLLICKANDKLYAYKNNCPACDRPFNNGTLKDTILSCKLGHSYDIQKAGICTDDPNIHLHPFPLLEQHGMVKISMG